MSVSDASDLQSDPAVRRRCRSPHRDGGRPDRVSTPSVKMTNAVRTEVAFNGPVRDEVERIVEPCCRSPNS